MEINIFIIIVAAALVVSEGMALTPALKDNSILQFFWRILLLAVGKR